MSTPLSGQDLRAAAEAHRELGPEYGDAVVDTFLEKVEARLDARVEARLAELMPRKRPLASLSSDQRRSLLTGMAIGGGVVGFLLGLLGYAATAPWHGNVRAVWAVVLIASIGSCLAGLVGMFRDRR